MRFTFSSALRSCAVLAIAALVATNGSVRAAMGAKTGIGLSWMDKTCKPCTDFYQFANGNWIKHNPIPPQYSTWGSFNILYNHNQDVLHSILEAANKANAAPGSNEQKIGSFYGSCMNTAEIDKAGTAPLQPLMNAIDGVASSRTLAPALAQLLLANVNAFFGIGSGADFKNSSMSITQIGQGGLGLPDRDYYLKTDAASKKLQQRYVAHVTQMFALLGETPAQAAADAQTVMTMETTLAKAQMSRVEERDPQKVYNKMDLAGLQKLAPNFDWATFFKDSGITPEAINVAQPKYFAALSSDLATWTPAQIKTYLKWQTIHTFASALPHAFEQANFAFYGQTLTGAKQQLDRWKRCTASVDRNLGEALGQVYVAKVFPPSAKAQALEMVKYVKSTLRSDMGQLSWMSPATKAKAQAKLDAFMLKIGYPDKWRSYAGLDVTNGAYASNLIAAYQFNNKFDYAHINKPVDRSLWGMTPPTVNAYYDPTVNEIVFPAGILQPPFFSATGDMAMNFGGIGAVIGHESTHGFDDEGSQFDAKGNLANWWTPSDKAKFNAREQCIINQYDALSPEKGVKENGKLVVGEATADLGGLTIAYKAFERWQAKHPRKIIDGYTPEQRFFLGWAHVWASSQRAQTIALRAKTDVHAYDKFRVNATVSNMPAFAKAWGCKAGSPMVRPAKQRCAIW